MIETILETPTPHLQTPSHNHFVQDESGQDLIDYALLAALVALGSVTTNLNLATKVASTFTHIQNSVSNSVPAGSPAGGSSGGSSGGSGGNYGGRHDGHDGRHDGRH